MNFLDSFRLLMESFKKNTNYYLINNCKFNFVEQFVNKVFPFLLLLLLLLLLNWEINWSNKKECFSLNQHVTTHLYSLTGGIPYQGWSEGKVVQAVLDGYQMPKPDHIDDQL